MEVGDGDAAQLSSLLAPRRLQREYHMLHPEDLQGRRRVNGQLTIGWHWDRYGVNHLLVSSEMVSN